MTAEVTYTNGAVPQYTSLNNTESKTVAASSSAPSNKPTGRVWVDTNASNVLAYIYNGSDWWPIPMGLIVKSSTVDTGTGYIITGSRATVNGSTCTFTADQDQRYAYEATVTVMGNNVGDVFSFNIQRNSSDVDVQQDIRIGTAGILIPVHFRYVVGENAGSVTYRIQVNRGSGSGGGQISGGNDVTVSHVGSATLV